MIGAGFVLTSVSGLAQPTIASELERGVELLEGGEELRKAKEHLEMVIQRDTESRRLAAEAYYHLAKCHLAMGEKKAARESVARLREGWPAGNAWVIRAGKLPLGQGIFREAPWASGERLAYEMKFKQNGQELGSAKFSTLIVASGNDGEEKWTVFDIGGTEISALQFAGDDYRPIRGCLMMPHAGIQMMDTNADGSLVLRHPKIEKPVATYPTGEGRDAIYHNHQAMDLVRVLPDKIGGSFDLPFIYPGEPWEPTTYRFKVTGEETVEVPAGKFDCVIFQMESEQGPVPDTYWVEKEGQRRVIKMTMAEGTAITTLVSSETERNLKESYQFRAGDQPGALQFKVPAGLVATKDPEGAPPFNMPGAQCVGLYDTELRVWSGLLTRIPVPDDARAEMEAKVGFDAIDGIVDKMEEHLSMRGPEPVKLEEVKEARKLLENGVFTRFMVEGPVKRERTLLFTRQGDSVILFYFDHQPGLGQVAARLMQEVCGISL
jgi:hypothetical protein